MKRVLFLLGKGLVCVNLKVVCVNLKGGSLIGRLGQINNE
jgi:hypothetical protein